MSITKLGAWERSLCSSKHDVKKSGTQRQTTTRSGGKAVAPTHKNGIQTEEEPQLKGSGRTVAAEVNTGSGKTTAGTPTKSSVESKFEEQIQEKDCQIVELEGEVQRLQDEYLRYQKAVEALHTVNEEVVASAIEAIEAKEGEKDELFFRCCSAEIESSERLEELESVQKELEERTVQKNSEISALAAEVTALKEECHRLQTRLDEIGSDCQTLVTSASESIESMTEAEMDEWVDKRCSKEFDNNKSVEELSKAQRSQREQQKRRRKPTEKRSHHQRRQVAVESKWTVLDLWTAAVMVIPPLMVLLGQR